jgi:hypothetical protein
VSNGKGSRRRPGSDPLAYGEGWDRIFGRKKDFQCPKEIQCTKEKRLQEYPSLVCSDCCTKVGAELLRETATWHTGDCEVCGITQWVTEPRDFGYPSFPGYKTRAQYIDEWAKTLKGEEAELWSLLKVIDRKR